MKHEAYYRINPSCDTAIIFIHGILGTPNHFNDFIELVPENYSIANILLDGHGKGVSDFSKTSMKKWRAQVDDVVLQMLKFHKKLIFVGHSMGTLLSIEQAIKHKEAVEFLFLLAAPLKLFLKPTMFIDPFKIYFGKIKPTDKKTLAAKNRYGIADDKRFWKYAGWLPRFFELFGLIRDVRRSFPELESNCYVYQSRYDEMVSLSSRKVIEKNEKAKLFYLNNSNHCYYEDDDYGFLLSEFDKLINGDDPTEYEAG